MSTFRNHWAWLRIFRRGTAILPVAALLGFVAVAAWQWSAALVAETNLAPLAARLGAARITADPWRQKVAIEDVTFRRAGLAWHIGRVVVPFASPSLIANAYALDATSPAGAGALTADNITIDADEVHYAIKHIEVTGTSLAKSDLDAILDPKSTLSAADRLAKLSASHIGIPEIVIRTGPANKNETETYRDVTLDDVAQGHVGKVAIAGLTSTLISPTANTMQSAYGPIKMNGVDLRLAAQIVAEPRQNDSEAPTTLYDSVDIEGGKIFGENSNVEIDIGSIFAKDIKARRLHVPLHSIAGVFASQDAQTNNQHVAAYLADVLDSFEVGSTELNNLRFTVAKDAPATVTFARVYLHQMTAGKIGEIGYDNFAVASNGTTIKIGTINCSNIDLGRLRDLLTAVAKSNDRASFDAATVIPLVSRISLGNIDADVASSAAHSRFQIASIDTTSSDVVDGSPRHISSALDHFTIDLKNGGVLSGINELGYDKLDASSRLDVHLDPSKQELGLNEFSVSGAEMGAVKVAGTFGNVSKDLLSSDPARVEAAALSILIRRFEIKVENAGLLDKLITAAAKKDNISAAQVREKYVSTASISVPVILGNSAGAKTIGAAIAKFLAAPKNLRIVAVAPKGLGISDLHPNDIGAVLSKLSIEATANE